MTTAIAIDSLLECIFLDEYVLIIVSPSQRQSERMMRYIDRAFIKLQKELKQPIELVKHTRDHILFHHGSEIWSLPNNPTTIQGFDADKVIIDEAGIFPTNEGTAIYEATIGSLGAKGGGMSLSGMPYGRGKFFYDIYDKSLKGQNNFSMHYVDWLCRAKQDPVYKQSIEEQQTFLMPLLFDQLYNCKFVDENIVLFSYDLLERNTDDKIRLVSGKARYGSDNPIFFGIDFAKKVDRTSIVAVEKYEADRYKVVLVVDTNDTYDKQMDLIKRLNENLMPQKIFIDESGPGGPMLDFLTRDIGGKVIPIAFSAQNKERLMLDMYNMFQDRKLKIPAFQPLIDELHSIEKTVTESGNVRYYAPREDGGHADKAFALSMAINQLQQNNFRFSII
jgi:phage FluMu gp28-like protein